MDNHITVPYLSVYETMLLDFIRQIPSGKNIKKKKYRIFEYYAWCNVTENTENLADIFNISADRFVKNIFKLIEITLGIPQVHWGHALSVPSKFSTIYKKYDFKRCR